MPLSLKDETNSEETTDMLFGRFEAHLEAMAYHDAKAKEAATELRRRLPPDAPLLDAIDAATKH